MTVIGDSLVWDWLLDCLKKNKYKVCRHESTQQTWVDLGGRRVTCTVCCGYRIIPNVAWRWDWV